MSKTSYAAFYLRPETTTAPQPDVKLTQKIKDRLTEGCKNIKKTLGIDIPAENIREMAQNINLQGGTELVQLYAVGAITDIMSGYPVTNLMMLDSLFNTYAPALNAGLLQCGYNSLMELRTAVKGGTVNIANFVQGVSHGLKTIQDIGKSESFAKFGEEIPIDVVEKLEYTYKAEKAHQKIYEVYHSPQYVTDLDPVKIIISGHVKNQNAELWNLNDFNNKIFTIMSQKKDVFFRVGKSVYENCIITSYKPTITNIYDISFTADISFDYRLATNAERKGTYRIMNPTHGRIREIDTNLYAPEMYDGIVTGRIANV